MKVKKAWVLFATAGITLATQLWRIARRRNSGEENSAYNENSNLRGPHGEKVFTGPAGGRYYFRNNRKIYLKFREQVNGAMMPAI